MPQIIETMTIQELYRKMKALGLKTSVAHISGAIEQGVYPFASCIKTPSSRIFEIYSKLFDKWVQERAIEENQDSARGDWS